MEFSVTIQAPPERVWETAFADHGYRQWTVPFCEGSYFEGSWESGARMRFLAPGGAGMVAEIAESQASQTPLGGAGVPLSSRGIGRPTKIGPERGAPALGPSRC